MRLRPITQRVANAHVKAHHRHLATSRGDVIRVGLEAGGELVGVAQAGRPVARMLDDGWTLEVTRVAVMAGYANGCSMLYGSLARAAKSLGYRRIITYIREDEPGTSLRAAGWNRDGEAGGGEWHRESRPRQAALQGLGKVRWSRTLAGDP